MSITLNRRSFLKRSALLAGALSTPRILPAATITPPQQNSRLNCALIGCGGRAMTHLEWLANQSKDNLLAIVDPDENRHAAVRAWLEKHQLDSQKPEAFTDYRHMFDKVGNQLDAVFIAAPNHHHAAASLIAMQLGKAVFCEKPLCHDIAEARKLRHAASLSKRPAQMGNQGHCEEGYLRLCELVWAGVAGNITETHSWTDRANGGFGPRPPALPTPAGLHWDSWLGPARFRDYHADLHPHEWHGWYDFGNGSLGNMGCHILDGVFWALKLEHPTSIEAEEIRDGTNERYPTGSRVRWDFPARGDMPAVRVYWYEGLRKNSPTSAIGNNRQVLGDARNVPPLLLELQKQYPDEEFDANGTLYVGDKAILYTGTYGGRMHLLPIEKMKDLASVPRTLPRPKNVMADFLDACRSGRRETSASFDYGARLTEFVLLGNLAQHAGVGKKLEWDGPEMKVTNLPDLDEWVRRPYRSGWPA